MTFTQIDLSQTSNSSRNWTQEAVNMAAPCWKLMWDWYVSGFKLMGNQEWENISVKSMRDIQFTSIQKKHSVYIVSFYANITKIGTRSYHYRLVPE